jgi:hypothetical protein
VKVAIFLAHGLLVCLDVNFAAEVLVLLFHHGDAEKILPRITRMNADQENIQCQCITPEKFCFLRASAVRNAPSLAFRQFPDPRSSAWSAVSPFSAPARLRSIYDFEDSWQFSSQLSFNIQPWPYAKFM